MKLYTYSLEGLNFIEVSNDLDLKVTFCDLGASIFNITFNNESMTRNVKNIKDFKLPECYYGKTIGRTSNRLKSYRFDIHDEIYTLEPNEDDNVLHGGKNGLSNKIFKAVVNVYEDYYEIVFTYESPDLEGGYPGKVNIIVKYLIWAHINRLDVRYNARSDKDTLFSLTNHSYFTLGDKDISNLELMIKSHQYLSVDKQNLLPKDIRMVNNMMNFFNYKKLSEDIDNNFLKGKMMNGYDSFWYFDEVNEDKVNASLRNDRYQMDIMTSFEGVQVYSSNYEPKFKLDGELQLRDSVALEPSNNFLEFPVLLKDQIYHKSISYIFNKIS